MKSILIIIFCVFLPKLVFGGEQNLLSRPGWENVGGSGDRFVDDQTGTNGLVLTSDNLDGTVYWRLYYPLKPGQLYEMSVRCRVADGTLYGAMMVGTDFYNHDSPATTEWLTKTVRFIAPHNADKHYLRLGMWQGLGTAYFADLRLEEITPVFHQVDNTPLGAQEMIEGDRYSAHFYYAQSGSNFARPLVDFSATFNTNRWDFWTGASVTYRHDLSASVVQQTGARLTLKVNYYTQGKLQLEAGRDGEHWLPVGSCDKTGVFTFQLPAELFPALTVFIRLKAVGLPARVQIDEYDYAANLSQPVGAIKGKTSYAKMPATNSPLRVESINADERVAVVQLADNSPRAEIAISADTSVAGKETVKLPPGQKFEVKLPPGSGASPASPVSFSNKGASEELLVLEETGAPYLDWADYGFLLAQNHGVTFWWTDATRKIGRLRPPPTEKKPVVEMWLARHEFEAAQLVLTPQTDLHNIKAEVGELRHSSGVTLAKELVSIYAVDYVPVKIPTDQAGSADWWPDPLPPLTAPLTIAKNTNQPLWISVYVPEETPAGEYNGTIKIAGNDWTQNVPLRVHVWDFALPRETHLQTAVSLFPELVRRYHHIATNDSLRPVLDKYFENFSQHRISPYDPFFLHPIKAKVDKEKLTVTADFTAFDRAYKRYIEQFGFNSFRLHLEGLPAGSSGFRGAGQLGGFKQGSAEYNILMPSFLSQVEQHLEQLGALDKAYFYWFDEPEPKDYEFVRENMEFLGAAAPKIQRMLTEQPAPELYGAVDLWCPHTYHFQPETARVRRLAGERFWWYISTQPKAPFATLFIDHYAVEMRTLMWQAWHYGIDGFLVWAANYWTSHNVFPWPEAQNPYTDPMSYASGGALKPGEISYWGNGDGRFLYPPKAVFDSEKPCREAPVNSIRWEMLREGLEDYEYLWLARDLADRLEKKNPRHPLVQQARALLVVPREISRSLADFGKQPEPIYAHRHKLAEMIFKLEKEIQ